MLHEKIIRKLLEVSKTKIKKKFIKLFNYTFSDCLNKFIGNGKDNELEGFPNFDDIINYIEQNKLDLETAGKELNLSNEQVDLIKLIFAREFYKQGDMEKGNYYLNSVEKTRGKTSEVTRLCLEARTNKKFFQYRDNNNPKKLSVI